MEHYTYFSLHPVLSDIESKVFNALSNTDFLQAKSYIKECVSLVNESEVYGFQPFVDYIQAKYLKEVGKHDEAIILCEKSISKIKEEWYIGAEEQELSSKILLAKLYYNLKNIQKSNEVALDVIQFLKNKNPDSFQFEIFGFYGEAYNVMALNKMEQFEFKDAIPLLKKALENFISVYGYVSKGIATVYGNLSVCYTNNETRDIDESLRCIKKAIDISEQGKFLKNQYYYYTKIAYLLYGVLGRKSESLDYLQKAIGILDNAQKNLSEDEQKYYRDKFYVVFPFYIQFLLELNRVDEAIKRLDTYKRIGGNQPINIGLKPIQDNLQDGEVLLSYIYNDLTMNILAIFKDDYIIYSKDGGLHNQVEEFFMFHIRTANKHIKKENEIHKKEIERLKRFFEDDSIPSVKVFDKTVDEYFKFFNREASEFISKEEMDDSYYVIDRKLDIETYSSSYFKLFFPDEIWSAIQKRDITKISIIPDKFLIQFPFEAIISPNRKYLIEDFVFRYSNSFSQWLTNRNKSNKKIFDFKGIVVGGEEYGDGNGDNDKAEEDKLSYSLNECELISQHFNVTTYNSEVHKRDLLEGFLQLDVQFLHFATHAYTIPKFGSYSGIILPHNLKKRTNNQNILTVGDIKEHDIKANMVFLSGCQTGLGDVFSGAGQIGLKEAFFKNGSEMVISTLWKVDDENTYDFVKAFYSELEKSKILSDIPEIIANIKREMIRKYSDKRESLPYFWAGYICFEA